MRVRGAAIVIVCLTAAGPPSAAESTCYGTTASGALRDGCELPASGKNFSSYSRLGRLMGRTWVHCSVRAVVVESYAAIATVSPKTVFVYGETGLAAGGRFRPHKTHQNGLSVDLMVPVLDTAGRSVPLPTSALNKFGYGIEFSLDGRFEDLAIDFEAMAAHLAAVRATAASANVGIRRVIFDPELQAKLRSTAAWPAIEGLPFSTGRAWVRHDEHYHVDFEIPCKPLDALER
jgi:penicillin-insensitive murein endopeptidase